MVQTNPDLMKKQFIFFVLIPLLLASCKKDDDPQPVEIRAYASIISLLREPFAVTWVVDGVEVPDEQAYGSRIMGGILLEGATEEISFTAKNSDTGAQIESLLITMDRDKDYLIVLYGSAEETLMQFQELETSRPEPAHVKFLFLHAAASVDSVDIYMGGTEVGNREVSDLSFSEQSEYFQVSDYNARTSVTVTEHGDVYDPEKELLNYTFNDLIVSNAIYFSVLGHANGDPEDSDLKLWLFDLPTQ
jgi:hypothetical protein